MIKFRLVFFIISAIFLLCLTVKAQYQSHMLVPKIKKEIAIQAI